MSELENTTTEETTSEEGVIELEWEEVREIFEIRKALVGVESTLSSMMLEFEKRKAAFLHRARELEASMYQAGGDLRLKKQLNEELTYEVKLPSTEGEKGYFIRKDSTN